MKEWIIKDTLNNKYVQELVRCVRIADGGMNQKHTKDLVFADRQTESS